MGGDSLVVLTEVGPNLSRFKTEKHFCSWLGLCPDNRISGGKVLSSRTRRVINRVSDALRMAATTLERSQTALGGFYRRMKARLGAAEGITATAHKLARIIYRLIKLARLTFAREWKTTRKNSNPEGSKHYKEPPKPWASNSFQHRHLRKEFLKRIRRRATTQGMQKVE